MFKIISVITAAASMACVQKAALIVTVTLWANIHCCFLVWVCMCTRVPVCVSAERGGSS